MTRFSIFTSGLSDMKLATLVTNTDFSDFAKARPLDDAKFAALIAEVRPEWTVEAFWVCKGDFPEELSVFDGIMVTGSPASVNDAEPWIEQLQVMLRGVVAEGKPLFGACFGHQIIAKALGSQVIRNPDGWAHGLLDVIRVGDTPWSGPDQRLRLYGSHVEQVDTLPKNAKRIFESPGCPIAGFSISTTVFTIQHHPEMSPDFFSDLVSEYASYVGPEVTEAARASLVGQTADGRVFASEVARFFEQARR